MTTDPHWTNIPPTLPPGTGPDRRRRGLSVLVLIVGMFGGFIGGAFADSVTDGGDPASSPLVTANKVEQAKVGSTSVAKAVAVITPSIVTVDSLSGDGEAIGTGIIISSDGEVVTNAHVVDGAETVRVVLVGETEPRTAEVLASDPSNDLALLRIKNAGGLTAATFADPAGVAVGDAVVAVGYALDLDGGPSVTNGIVSALNRTMQDDDGALNALIQTDAAISSGNSGGPLINMEGHVVGVNTAVARSTGTSAANNIGFAIHVGEVKRVIGVLRDEAGGTTRGQGYLGIGLTDRTDGGVGAVVVEVASGSPAEKAGLEVKDVILEVNDQPITGQGALIGIIRDAAPGETARIVILRDDKRSTVSATLVARPEN